MYLFILFSFHPTLLGHVSSNSFEVNMSDFTMTFLQPVHDTHGPFGDQVVRIFSVYPPPSSAEAFVHFPAEQGVDEDTGRDENTEPPTVDIG
jgi:hypothetical protein